MYVNGLGPRDYVQAYMWLSLSEAQGTPDAQRNREIVERYMTAAQTAEARELARGWKPKPMQ
jgi:TPR repeat protein